MEAHHLHHEKKSINLSREHGTAKDPICGMDVVVTPKSLQHEHRE